MLLQIQQSSFRKGFDVMLSVLPVIVTVNMFVHVCLNTAAFQYHLLGAYSLVAMKETKIP